MKKVFAIAFLVICLFSFSILSLAADDVNLPSLEFDSQEELDSYMSKYSVSHPLESSPYIVDSAPSISYSSSSDSTATVFIPDTVRNGVTMKNGFETSLWFESLQAGFMGSVYDGHYFVASTYQTRYTWDSFQISGFDSDSTYSGVIYFEVYVPQRGAVNAGQAPLTASGWPSGSSFTTSIDLVSSIVPVEVEVLSPTGQSLPCYITQMNLNKTYSNGGYIGVTLYTFYITLGEVYFPAENASTSTSSVTARIRWDITFASSQDFYSSEALPSDYGTGSVYIPSPYGFCFGQSQFSGVVRQGQHTFDSDNREEIASEQASLSESQHEELINGYENSAGNAAIDSGQSAVESGVASEDQELDSAASLASDFDYEEADLSSLATAFSLISGWFMAFVSALGGFNMLIYVSLALVVALFAVGYFRH